MKIVTHDGPFHADEVTAVALLHVFKPFKSDPWVVRTRDLIAGLTADVVVDVSGRYDPDNWLLDHHQFKIDERMEYNEIPLSSAGMTLMNLYDKGFINKELRDELYNRFICGVDAIDNGIDLDGDFKCATLSSVISTYNDVEDVFSEKQQEYFMDAVNFVMRLIMSIWGQLNKRNTDRIIVKQCIMECAHQTWLELPSYVGGWQKVLSDEGKLTQFSRVIWPQKDGEGNKEWRVQVPPKKLGSFELSHPPLNGDHVDKDELVFVHSAKFIGATKSLNSAKML